MWSRESITPTYCAFVKSNRCSCWAQFGDKFGLSPEDQNLRYKRALVSYLSTKTWCLRKPGFRFSYTGLWPACFAGGNGCPWLLRGDTFPFDTLRVVVKPVVANFFDDHNASVFSVFMSGVIVGCILSVRIVTHVLWLEHGPLIVPRLIQITDTHIYAESRALLNGVDTRESFRTVYDWIRLEEPAYDAVVVTGDLAMDGSREAYAFLASAFGKEKAPVLCLPGNHDEPDCFTSLGSGSHPVLDLPYWTIFEQWRLLFLSTFVRGQADGAISVSQIEWLKRTLASEGDYFDAVFLHHPPISIGSTWMDAVGLVSSEALWETIEAYGNVRLIVFGHIHQNFDHYRGGVRLLGTPSTCVQFTPRAASHTLDSRPPGYRVIELDNSGAVVSWVVRVRLSE